MILSATISSVDFVGCLEYELDPYLALTSRNSKPPTPLV